MEMSASVCDYHVLRHVCEGKRLHVGEEIISKSSSVREEAHVDPRSQWAQGSLEGTHFCPGEAAHKHYLWQGLRLILLCGHVIDSLLFVTAFLFWEVCFGGSHMVWSALIVK